MVVYDNIQDDLRTNPRRWLITGVAGFIGSNLLEKLLSLDQLVMGLDNFATGFRRNLDEVSKRVTPAQWKRFRFIEGDICSFDHCVAACADVDYVLHQAALGSVPRSLQVPLQSHQANVDGFINMLVAARDARVTQVVYASSSSVYGDHPALPKTEGNIGRPLSPYAATKFINEVYGDVFGRCYQFSTIGLRYFNVFGPRQNPVGEYAAVIPKWFDAFLNGENITINGAGDTSRDFCYIENVVQANLLAATNAVPGGAARVFNIACGGRTTLLELFREIRELVATVNPAAAGQQPVFGPERQGDVRHSLADITAAKGALGYCPSHDIRMGLAAAFKWYADGSGQRPASGARH